MRGREREGAREEREADPERGATTGGCAEVVQAARQIAKRSPFVSM